LTPLLRTAKIQAAALHTSPREAAAKLKAGKNMKDEEILNTLEEALERLSIRLAYEDLRKGEVNTSGGLCVVRGEKRALIHKGLSVKDRIEVLAAILSGLDTEAIHLPPAVRKKLDKNRS